MALSVENPLAPSLRDRQKKLKITLLTASARLTKEGSLQALARELGVNNETLSNWIRKGEMPPGRARTLLLMPGINPPGEPEITFGQLVSSLADVL